MKMKTVVFENYGPAEVLEIKDVVKPIPKNKEILIKTHATTVTIGDVIVRSGRHPNSKFQSFMLKVMIGLTKPKNSKRILGMELVGEIEDIGSKVTKFNKGDNVIASMGMGFGAYSEYRCLSEDGVIALNPNLNEEDSAGLASGGITALVTLRKANIQQGQKVLIYGASGGVGTFAVQIAKYLGAEVTGVCSTKNLDMVKSLGADKVLDYTKEDFVEKEEKYEVIFDAVAKIPSSHGKKALKKDGIYLNVIRDSPARIHASDLEEVIEIAKTGQLKGFIDKTYSIKDIVAAHKYVEKGHKRGNVLVRMNFN